MTADRQLVVGFRVAEIQENRPDHHRERQIGEKKWEVEKKIFRIGSGTLDVSQQRHQHNADDA